MEPNHQLFSHLLRYRMKVQQGMTERDDENTSGQMVVSSLRAALGKLLTKAVTALREWNGWKRMRQKMS
jgi:hypothetical protein